MLSDQFDRLLDFIVIRGRLFREPVHRWVSENDVSRHEVEGRFDGIREFRVPHDVDARR